MRDRLRLDDSRLASMAHALREVANLPDPVGEIRAVEVRPSGIRVEKVGVPLGVIFSFMNPAPTLLPMPRAFASKPAMQLSFGAAARP